MSVSTQRSNETTSSSPRAMRGVGEETAPHADTRTALQHDDDIERDRRNRPYDDDIIEQFVARTTTACGVPLLLEDLAIVEQIARVLA